MERALTGDQKTWDDQKIGTLAIDLGNSTTVVAFQEENSINPRLLELPPISRVPGEIPSLVVQSQNETPNVLVGQQVLDLSKAEKENINICSDFKRWIGADQPPLIGQSKLLPAKAGELLIRQIWKRLPPQLIIKRLVLTAPVDTYRTYRSWLKEVCSSLLVDEIALVDEPTAAAMGAGVPAGSKLLVIDIGGCTIDLSLVALEGGEGRAEPVAQLLRFAGEELEGKSTQILRCAKVLGKNGLRLGGRDFDRWIAHHLCPNEPLEESLLNAAERLKCRLSENGLNPTEILEETFEPSAEGIKQYLRLNKNELEKLLIERGVIRSLAKLLSKTLQAGEANNCLLKDLHGVVLVGGCARIPLISKWLKGNIKPATLLTPPPIEAVAKGALSLTPGVTIRDVLQRGASLRCWDKKSEKHIWHQLFIGGQPWPTSKPLELVLSASKENQQAIDLIIGEPELKGAHEVIYINGIPTIKKDITEYKVTAWKDRTFSFFLNPPGQPGQDCLRLKFSINSDSYLQVEGIDLRTGDSLETKNLGRIN